MTRTLENRILGGVCSGLGQSSPISAWIWRILFIILTPLTAGAAILLYAMLWWLLPEKSFGDVEGGSFIRTLLALALIVLVIGGGFLRSSLLAENGNDLYLPAVLVLTALIFLSQQFKRGSQMRNNVILGLVFVAMSLFFLIGSLGVLQPGLYDMVLRSMPALLIFFGLSVILRERVALGGLVALAVSIILPLVLASLAFSGQVNQVLTDNTVDIQQAISADMTTLTLDLTALTSNVEIRTGAEAGMIRAQFIGSSEHNFVLNYTEVEDGNAIAVLQETQTSDFPILTAIGRGTIDLQLPPDFPTLLKVAVNDGNVVLNLRDSDLESIETLTVNRGSAIISLPSHQPTSPSALDSGVLTLLNGNLTLRIPDNVGASFILSKVSNNRPVYDDLIYLLEDRPQEWNLSPRNSASLTIQVSYITNVPQGTVEVQVLE